MSFRITAIQQSKALVSDVKASFRRRQELQKVRDPRRRQFYEHITLAPEQEAAIDRLYLDNYGEKIPYTWHRLYTSYTGHFDVNYFPELLYIPEFERFENLWEDYVSVLADKNLTPMLAAQAGVRTARTVLSCTKGMCRDGAYRQLSPDEALMLAQNAGEVFCKPSVDSSSGRGCFVARFENGTDALSGESAGAVLERLGMDFVMQERLVCHESIRAIYPGSVNPFRLPSYRWKDDILFFPSIMRTGRGGNHVDNAHAGGVFIAVDDDGTLHRQAFSEFRETFERHPDTGLVYDGYRIPLFPEVKKAARRMHEIVPQLGVVNWDFTIDRVGEPVLIEANVAGGSVWLCEIAHGRGAFGENTAEVLRWLRLMKNTKNSERPRYAFGKGV